MTACAGPAAPAEGGSPACGGPGPFPQHPSSPACSPQLPLLVSLHFVSQTFPDTSSGLWHCCLPGSFPCRPLPLGQASLSGTLFTHRVENALCICWVSFETGELISLFIPSRCPPFLSWSFIQRLLMEMGQRLCHGPARACVFCRRLRRRHSIGPLGISTLACPPPTVSPGSGHTLSAAEGPRCGWSMRGVHLWDWSSCTSSTFHICMSV